MSGKYTEFDIQPNGNLRITLLKEAREDVQEIRTMNITADNKFAEAIEYQLSNGWTWVSPEDIGALTEAPILTDNIETDDQGKVMHLGVTYWYPQYEVLDPLEQLLLNGFVEFTQAEQESTSKKSEA